jgi:hypothetical protein
VPVVDAADLALQSLGALREMKVAVEMRAARHRMALHGPAE